MHKPTEFLRLAFVLVCAVCAVGLILPAQSQAAPGSPPGKPGISVPEVPSTHYDSILYAEIEPLLRQIERSSKRVKVDVIGQSAGGRDLFLVTLSEPETLGRLGRYMAIRKLMLTDPDAAQDLIQRMGDFKVPIFINASIHGNEYPGVDAALRLIQTLAYEDSPEVQLILENVILLVNVVQNPDGRVLGTRANANGFDLNRDFVTQSQPETRATVELLTEWNPMVVLDLHGFITPMLIEPCTPLHNPNYEYDLYIKWAYYEAEAMEAELYEHTGFLAQIPFRDDELGWDDWPPTYTPMYAMFHGAYGHTLETPHQDERGVDAHYWAVWGALKYAAQNREAMVMDQIEIFRRGFLDLPQMLIPDELLAETQFDQYNALTIQEFPAAYLLPAEAPAQLSGHQAARLVDFLLFNDVQVEQAVTAFSAGGVSYPAGTYIVWMNQPKRGLANTLLEDGWDLSYLEGISFYSPPAVWSLPRLWGVQRVVIAEPFSVESVPVERTDPPVGGVEPGLYAAYAFQPTSLPAIQAANAVLAAGERLDWAPVPFSDGGVRYRAGTFILPADSPMLPELVSQYAVQVDGLSAIPPGLVTLHQPALAVTGDEGTRHALRQMGFAADVLSAQDLNTDKILNYELFVNQSASWSALAQPGKTAFGQFAAAGGDYLGLRSAGARFAIDAGILDVVLSSASGNAIVNVDYLRADPLAAGFWETDTAFVNSPVWFPVVSAEVDVLAWLDDDAMLVSGFWPGWKESYAAGSPLIVRQVSGGQVTTAIGLDATFRGHPENTFRLLANAIFASQSWP